MGEPPGRPRFGYDVFLSHSHVDREWVHALAHRLASEKYHGRLLRPWLDEQVLDPGDLAGDAELTTALDRSRLLALVLSPESAASHYVGVELRHFLSTRGPDALVSLRLRDGPLPPALQPLADAGTLRLIDFREEGGRDSALAALLERIRPPGGPSLAEVDGRVDRALEAVEATDPGGFSPGPTPERDALHDTLLTHDVDDAATEGLALRGFQRAAEHLLRMHRAGSDATYDVKMLLAECLTAALLRTNGYRRVAHSLLDLDRAQVRGGGPGGPLPFVVARAYGKLADADPSLVDLGMVMRLAAHLDARVELGDEERATGLLLSRTAGKLRDTFPGELLIKALSEGGRVSRAAAAAAVSMSAKRSAPVHYLSATKGIASGGAPPDPPSRRLLGLLKGLDMDPDPDPYVTRWVTLARQDLERDHPGIDLPYPLFWFPARPPIPALHPVHAPFMGVVVRATVADMGVRAEEVDVSTVACLVEPRVVDALFWNGGALLVPEQDPDSHQCRRLRARGAPFAMLPAAELETLEDGEVVVVDHDTATVWRG